MARDGLELTLRGRLDVVSDGGWFIRQAGLLVLPPPPVAKVDTAEPAGAD